MNFSQKGLYFIIDFGFGEKVRRGIWNHLLVCSQKWIIFYASTIGVLQKTFDASYLLLIIVEYLS